MEGFDSIDISDIMWMYEEIEDCNWVKYIPVPSIEIRYIITPFFSFSGPYPNLSKLDNELKHRLEAFTFVVSDSNDISIKNVHIVQMRDIKSKEIMFEDELIDRAIGILPLDIKISQYRLWS